MARRNLKYQFLQAINNSFRENMDKHSDKANGIRNTDKIYSYSARSNLIDLSANFANFMKESYPEIHKANEVGTEHIQAFLNSKTENCSQATLNQYSALFRKLEKCVNVKYHCNVVYHCDVVPASCKNGGGKIRNVMLSQSDFKTLIKNTSNQNLKKALTLSYHFGLRAAECAKLKFEDIKSNGISIIDSKGKKSRFILAETEKQKQILEQIKERKQGRIFHIQHVLEKNEIMKNKEISEQHEQFCKIWHATDGRYKTKLPDKSKSNGKKMIAKKCREDLEKCIIKYYKGRQEQKANPRTMKALYPEWLKYKAVDTSKANATKLQWVWNTYYADSEIVNMDISSIDVIIIKEWFIKVIKKYELSSRKYKEMKSVANMLLDYAVEKRLVSTNVSRCVHGISSKKFTEPLKKEVTE